MEKAVLLDYLFLQGRVMDRIESIVNADAKNVEIKPIEDLRQATEANVRDNLIYVLWDGDQFASGDGGRAGSSSQIVTQTWSIVYAKRSADQHDRAARNSSSGPMLATLHKAIAGWTPEGTFRPFRRVNGRKPSYLASVALYPLSFSIDLTL